MTKRKKRKMTNLTPNEIKNYVFSYLRKNHEGTHGGYKKEGNPKIGTATFYSYRKKFFEELDGILEKEEKEEKEEKKTFEELEEKCDHLQWKVYGVKKGWLKLEDL